MSEGCSIGCIYHILFIHSTTDGHLSCSHLLAPANSAAMNTAYSLSAYCVLRVQVPVCNTLGYVSCFYFRNTINWLKFAWRVHFCYLQIISLSWKKPVTMTSGVYKWAKTTHHRQLSAPQTTSWPEGVPGLTPPLSHDHSQVSSWDSVPICQTGQMICASCN